MIFLEFLIWLFKVLLLMAFCLAMACLAIFIIAIFYGQGVEEAFQIFVNIIEQISLASQYKI